MEQASSYSDFRSQILILQSRMADIIAKQADISSTVIALNVLSDSIAEHVSKDMLESVQLSLRTLPVWAGHLRQTMQGQEMSSSLSNTVEVSNNTLESFLDFSPLIPEEQRKEFQEIVSPEQGKEHKILTIENLKWLLLFIATLLAPILPKLIEEEPTKYEEASMQAQYEFLEKFQELVDLLELRENQSAEIGDKPDVLSDEVQSSVEPAAFEKQPDSQPNQETNQNSQP